jgi:2-(1,2-epoxy-1,2-dihydrophenyl)acetyl-CoA isomerase
MTYSTMTYDVRDGVAHLRFTRPDHANAVNPTFSADLRAAMIEITFDPAVKAVSVTADGKVFCAGGDLKLFHEAGNELASVAASMLVDFHGAIYTMNTIPKPFVAGVRGAAGGAGLSLMSAFDLVVAGESAKFTMAYTRAGVTPDGTSTYFLARHIGLRRMLDLTLTNRVLTAAEAESWGLVNRVVPDDDVDTATAELAQQLADGATMATGLAKRVVYQGYELGLADAG